MCTEEIQRYEQLREEYQQKIESRMSAALKHIRKENSDEHLVHFFFTTAINHMSAELEQKRKGSLPMMFF